MKMAVLGLRSSAFWCCLLGCAPFVYTILDDSILYNLNWPGRTFDLVKESTDQEYKDENTVIVQTENSEKYKCMIPSSKIDKSHDENFQEHSSPVHLLSPILASKPCTYRLEAYWTYEICHGKHIRQYHEDKAAGGMIKRQEYFLGYFTEEADHLGIFTGLGNVPQNPGDIQTKKIDGVLTPYYALQMKNGTDCSLKGGAKRKTQVLYVCHPESRNEIMSISETSSCEYEVIILTPVLCQNPFYKVKGNPVNEIYCTPVGDSPRRPQALEQEINEMALSSKGAVFKRSTSSMTKSEETEIDIEPTKDDYRRVEGSTISLQTDKALLRDFLSGDFCLKGSSGWWNYEFCYGKHVKQYHDDKTDGRTTINLGFWDEDAHKEWAGNKNARISRDEINTITNKKERKVIMVEHFYNKGDFCDAIGKRREVVVKLKCKLSSSKHAVTIYLREPSTCSYILGVESPIICDLLDTADENGLFRDI